VITWLMSRMPQTWIHMALYYSSKRHKGKLFVYRLQSDESHITSSAPDTTWDNFEAEVIFRLKSCRPQGASHA